MSREFSRELRRNFRANDLRHINRTGRVPNRSGKRITLKDGNTMVKKLPGS